MRAVRAQGIGGSATAWQSMGCADIVALTLPGDPLHAAHPTLAQPSPAARGDQRGYGEAPARLRRGSRPVRGGGRSGRQPVRGQRLACLGRRPGSAVSTKTPVNSKGEGPSTVRPLTGARLRLAKSGRRLEFKLYLALAPSRHVSALRNLMLVLSTV